MWNYRIVRKKHVWQDPRTQEKKESYLYGIHEAYYDKAGKVGAITEIPVEPSGETIEDLRHSWMRMAEAFGQPLLDYDNIPEPGYIDESEDEEFEVVEITREPMTQEKLSDLDAELERERSESEQQHQEFVGTPTLKALLEKIFEDYANKQDYSGEQNLMTRDRIREIIAIGTIGLGSTSEQCAAALILDDLSIAPEPYKTVEAATRRLNQGQFDLINELRRERGLPELPGRPGTA